MWVQISPVSPPMLCWSEFRTNSMVTFFLRLGQTKPSDTSLCSQRQNYWPHVPVYFSLTACPTRWPHFGLGTVVMPACQCSSRHLPFSFYSFSFSQGKHKMGSCHSAEFSVLLTARNFLSQQHHLVKTVLLHTGVAATL